MIINISLLKRISIIVFCLFCIASDMFAQDTDIVVTNQVSGNIIDIDGNPVKGVMVKSYLLGNKTWSLNDGCYSLVVAKDDHINLSKEGFQEITLGRKEAFEKDTIVLSGSTGILDYNDISVNFKELLVTNTSGSVFRVSGEKLRRNPTNDLMQALNGLIPGFFMSQTSNTPGSVTYNMQLRGNSPVIMINGVPRDIAVDLEEIEEVVVYKDHSATAMYGNMGANGIINIITKKGQPNTKVFEADYQYGIHTPLALPEYLDAYQGALLVNQARQNDGLNPRFSNEALEAFRSGSDPLRYPNIDYYGDYLLANSPSHNLTTTFMGGDSTIQYYLHGGYQSNKGLESVGERITYDRLLLRSDLGVKLSDMIRLDLGITGWMDLSRNPQMGKDGMFGIMSSYPAYATPMMMGDSIYLVNRDYPNNLQSKLTAEGFSQNIRRTLNFNLGLTFDLSTLVEGLSLKNYVSLDLYNELIKGKGGNPTFYEPLFTTNSSGEDTTILDVYGVETEDLEIGHVNDNITRHYTYYFDLDFKRELGSSHFLNANLIYFQNALERKGKTGDVKSQMINGKLNYNYSEKYIADFYLSYTGTQKLTGENKFRLFPGFGVAWIASSEPFLQNSQLIDLLKIRASYGESGYVNISNYYVYQDSWYSSGNVTFGTKDKNSSYPAYELTQIGNPNAEWPVMKRLNIGFDAAMLNNSVGLTLDLYQNEFSAQLAQLDAFYTGMQGDSRYIPFENYNATVRKGIEVGISYSKNKGDLHFNVGGTFAWSAEDYQQLASLDYPDNYRIREGQRTDAIWGLEADGLFEDQQDITSSPTQMFGSVYPGDIKYVDQNNDNIIDEKDEVIIGHSTPTISGGLYFNIGYKNLSLFVQGSGIFGSDLLLNNSYYWNDGLEKYSSIMQGDYPRLSTYGSSNNYRLSDYWMESGNLIRLKTVELSYQLPTRIMKSLNMGLEIFIRGNNLFTLSSYKDLDPENTNAGVSIYPLYQTWATGITLKL